MERRRIRIYGITEEQIELFKEYLNKSPNNEYIDFYIPPKIEKHSIYFLMKSVSEEKEAEQKRQVVSGLMEILSDIVMENPEVELISDIMRV